MYLKLQVISWTCILYCLLYCQSEVMDFKPESIGTYINNLCDIRDGCTDSIDSFVEAEKLIGNTCCKDCPCKNNCSTVIADEFSDFMMCLKPEPEPFNTGGIKNLFEYKFVVKEPKEGCKIKLETYTDDTLPSCSSEIVTALGSNFYPVYSYDKKVNFKNKNCALCHGAKDLVYWDVYSAFTGKKRRTLETITRIFKNINSSDLSTWFVPPNKESRDVTKLCFVVIEHCKPGRKIIIPESVNFTYDQVRKACEEGPRFLFISGHRTWFKNVFCAFCNGVRFNENDLEYCERNFFGDGFRVSLNSFTFLLGRDYVDAEIENSANTTMFQRKLACKTGITSLNQVSCREVLCPVLQTIHRDGRCDYPFDMFNIGKIVITLNLTGPGNLQADLITNMSSTEIKLLFQKHSPWPSFWKILYIQIRIDLNNRLEFTVCIAFETTGPIQLRDLNELFKTSLAKSWVLDIPENDPIFLIQNIFAHGSITKQQRNTKSETVHPLWVFLSKNDSFLIKAEQPSWKRLYEVVVTDMYGEGTSIKKSFLCEQIKLHPTEYIFERDGLPLFLKNEERFIYPDEYYVYSDDSKGDYIAICLEDSAFRIFERNIATGQHRKMSHFVYKVLLLLLVLVCLCNF